MPNGMPASLKVAGGHRHSLGRSRYSASCNVFTWEATDG